MQDYQKMMAISRADAMANNSGSDTLLGGLGQAVGAMGLLGKARDIMDENQLKVRTDEIAQHMGAGGDLSAVPEELTKGRIGMVAYANVIDAASKTEQGKLKFIQSADQMAQHDYSMIAASNQMAKQLISNGDFNGAGKVISDASKLAGNPHHLDYDANTGKFNVMFSATPTGVPEATGQVMDVTQVDDLFKGLLSDSKQFRRTAITHAATILENNLAIAKNPDAWVEVKDKDGKTHDMVPQTMMQPGTPTETVYRNPTDGQIYNLDQLTAAGYSMPLTKAGGIKDAKRALEAEKATNAQANKEAEIDLKGKSLAVQQALGEGRLAVAAAASGNAAQNVALQRERLGLEQDKAANSKQAQALQRMMPIIGAQVGLQIKNGAFIEPDGEGGFRTVDDSDPRVVRALDLAGQFVNSFTKNGGKDGGPGLFPTAPPAKTQSYSGTVNRILGTK